MKIEKLNENQIRCTLTREDLANRELKISELAYGSEKAKSLFREMMQQAAYEVGFEANDIPLMIEAIPMSADTIILIITKVEDPEELDTRFAKFAPDSSSASDSENSFSSLKLEGADDILNLFQKIREAQKSLSQKQKEAKDSASSSEGSDEKDAADVTIIKLYGFACLDDVIAASSILKDFYTGENSLYRLPDGGEYRLILSKSAHTPEEFNKICNIISEYGFTMKYKPGTEAYLKEHGEAIVLSKALQMLSQLDE